MIFALAQACCAIMGAYLIGAIPSGYWFARLHGIADIRTFGSGNPGATNVGRALGLSSFLFVFIADCGKAFVYCMALQALQCDPQIILLATIALMMGNFYSIFLHGMGGKGVATFMGILCALYPLIAANALITWLLVFLSMRVVGIASAVAVLAVPWYAVGRGEWFEISVLAGLAFWIVWRHRENIRIYYQVR